MTFFENLFWFDSVYEYFCTCETNLSGYTSNYQSEVVSFERNRDVERFGEFRTETRTRSLSDSNIMSHIYVSKDLQCVTVRLSGYVRVQECESAVLS